MKLSHLAIVAGLVACSSTFAATEIGNDDTNGLKSLGTITVTQNTVNTCLSEVSRRADLKGAEFYVVKTVGQSGNGANTTTTAELFTKAG